MKIGEISTLIDGIVKGDASLVISGFNTLELAGPKEISFYHNPKYKTHAEHSNAACIIVDKFLENATCRTQIIVSNPYEAALIVSKCFKKPNEGEFDHGHFFESLNVVLGSGTKVGYGSFLAEGVSVGLNCTIYPQVYLGKNVKIGDDCILYPGVKVYHGSELGHRVIIHSNAVIGSDGFGYVPNANGEFEKIPQLGNVIIEDDVEIGANTTIDRATYNSTLIKKGTKIDNLVQIAHNVQIGQNSVMAAQSGIAGSGILGDNCQVGGQVAIVGHLSIANGTKIGGQSGVTRSVTAENTEINGTPAFNLKDNLRSHVLFRKLPEIWQKLTAIEKKINES